MLLIWVLKTGVYDDILANSNQSDYGDRLAIGANLLTHLLDADIKTINAMEKSEIVHQDEFLCSIENCSAKLGRLHRVENHLKLVHKLKDQLVIVALMSNVEKLNSWFAGCESVFSVLPMRVRHEKFCQFNPNKVVQKKISCKNSEYGCDLEFDTVEMMNKHATDCKYYKKNRSEMFACPNKCCKRLFTHKASVNPNVDHHCDFNPKKIEL